MFLLIKKISNICCYLFYKIENSIIGIKNTLMYLSKITISKYKVSNRMVMSISL